MSYHIYIKGQREPLELDTNQAEKVVSAFSDNNIEGSQIITVGTSSFRKSEIRLIRQGGEARNYSRPHWIIVNTKRNCIWKQPYNTFEEAKVELDLQIKRLNGRSHGFVIESRGMEAINNSFHDKSLSQMSETKGDREFADLVAEATALF